MAFDSLPETTLPWTVYLPVRGRIGMPTRLGRLGQFRPCPNCASVAVPTALTMPRLLAEHVPTDITEIMQVSEVDWGSRVGGGTRIFCWEDCTFLPFFAHNPHFSSYATNHRSCAALPTASPTTSAIIALAANYSWTSSIGRCRTTSTAGL